MPHSNLDLTNHVLPTTRIPNITDQWTSDQILNIIGYVLAHQIKSRIRGIKIKASEDDPNKYKYNWRFRYQYYMDKNNSIIYIYYDLPDDIEGLLNRGGVENVRERINNYMIDKVRFDTGYTPKILSPKIYYKDYRQDQWVTTSREYIQSFTIGLWKNKVNGSIEFIQDRDVFNLYTRKFRSKANGLLTNNDTLDNIITQINDNNIRLSISMRQEIAEMNERNRNNNTKEKSDQIIISKYNEYKDYLYNNYNIELPDYIEDTHMRVLNYDYDDTYKNIIKKNATTNFNVNV